MNNKATSIVTEDLKSRCKTVVYSFGKYEIKILLDEITNEFVGIEEVCVNKPLKGNFDISDYLD